MQVKKILKKNGLLIINEITQKQLFTTLTFGLTDGWWAYEDEETRINGTPLLNVSEWEVLLKSTGYSNQQILSSNNIEIDNSIQNVIIGESNGQVIISKSRINHLKKEIKRSITNNNVSVVHSDNHSKKDIKNIIIKVLSNSLQIDSTEFELHTPYVDFGVDSILAVEIIKRLNKELDIQLKPTDLFSFPTINQLTNHLESNNDRIRLPNKKTGTPIVEIREELTDNKSRKDMHEIDDLSEIDLDKVFQSLKNGTINVEEASLIMENLSNE